MKFRSGADKTYVDGPRDRFFAGTPTEPPNDPAAFQMRPGDLLIFIIDREDGYMFNAISQGPVPSFEWGSISAVTSNLREILARARRHWRGRIETSEDLSTGPLVEAAALDTDSSEALDMKRVTVPELVKLGKQAFSQLFTTEGKGRDGRLDKIGEAIIRAVDDGKKILVQADSLTLPWNSMFVARPALDSSNEHSATDGFLGTCANLFVTKRMPVVNDHPSSTVLVQRPYSVGVFYDRDLENREHTPPASAVIKLVNDEGIAVRSKISVMELIELIDADGLNDDLIYISGHVSIKDEEILLKLTGKWQISAKDIELRFSERQPDGMRLPRSPVVAINACSSSVSGEYGYKGFPQVFLDIGAKAVLATEADIPFPTAAEVGESFVKLVAVEGMQPNDAIRVIRKRLLLEDSNPLGLLYSVYGDSFERNRN